MVARLTFRDRAKGRAWQKVLRDEYLNEGAPGVDLKLSNARVRKVSRTMAAKLIMKYEWLGTMGQSGLHYGLFFGQYCAGVCCIATGGSGTAGNTVHYQFGIDRKDLLTLVRGACVHWAPSGANSKLVSWATKLAGKDTQAKMINAYSDNEAGEIGTIYQACGWIFIGYSKQLNDAQIISPDGRIYDRRNISSWAKSSGVSWKRMENCLRKNGWKYQDGSPKGRYVKQIGKDKNLSLKIESMKRPYPKRVQSIDSDAPGDQPGEGGAIPTCTLQGISL
tara:strand:+ start:4975 stop:5808 length:834 start_codon:yes stop_codon:yes gene_type:complete